VVRHRVCSVFYRSSDEKHIKWEERMADRPETSDILIDRLVERSVEQAVFGGRRDFLKAVGRETAAAMLADVFPMGAAKALAQAKLGPPEKKDSRSASSPSRARRRSSWLSPWASTGSTGSRPRW